MHQAEDQQLTRDPQDPATASTPEPEQDSRLQVRADEPGKKAARPPVRAKGARRAGRSRSVFSDLDLNGSVPTRVRPNISEWGPVGLPTTRAKKRLRWMVPVAFGLVVVAIAIAEWVFYTMYG